MSFFARDIKFAIFFTFSFRALFSSYSHISVSNFFSNYLDRYFDEYIVWPMATGPGGNFGKSLKMWYYLVLALGIVGVVVGGGAGGGIIIPGGPLIGNMGGVGCATSKGRLDDTFSFDFSLFFFDFLSRDLDLE